MQRRRKPIQYTRHRQKQPEIKVNSLEPSFQEEDNNSRNIFNEPSYVDDELSGIAPVAESYRDDDDEVEVDDDKQSCEDTYNDIDNSRQIRATQKMVAKDTTSPQHLTRYIEHDENDQNIFDLQVPENDGLRQAPFVESRSTFGAPVKGMNIAPV